MLYKFDNRILAIHQLRVNIKSLAAEAKIIRREVKRCSLLYISALTEHRKGSLRAEARYAQLAMGFIRNCEYKSIENKTFTPVNAERLYQKIRRFLLAVKKEEVEKWLGR